MALVDIPFENQKSILYKRGIANIFNVLHLASELENKTAQNKVICRVGEHNRRHYNHYKFKGRGWYVIFEHQRNRKTAYYYNKAENG